jgi:hypothetical protein
MVHRFNWRSFLFVAIPGLLMETAVQIAWKMRFAGVSQFVALALILVASVLVGFFAPANTRFGTKLFLGMVLCQIPLAIDVAIQQRNNRPRQARDEDPKQVDLEPIAVDIKGREELIELLELQPAGDAPAKDVACGRSQEE